MKKLFITMMLLITVTLTAYIDSTQVSVEAVNLS